MASSPPLSQLVLTRSIDQADAHLRHPAPDLQALQGAYVGNIERLEEHAERMSERGSDLGEEIRKLHSELKLTDSRRSSLRSNQPWDEPLRLTTTRSRGLSSSSHGNSIVDVNTTARWGGYSPAAYMTSPVGSPAAGAWNQTPGAGQRQRSESKASRLGQPAHAGDGDDGHARHAHHASPRSPPSAPFAGHEYETPPAHRKVSSFTRKYDEIAHQIQSGMHTSLDDVGYGYGYAHGAHDYAHDPYPPHLDHYDRPTTAASTDTALQVHTLWHDFDGAHATDAAAGPHPSLLRSLDPPPHGAPPPGDNMVFYPAPVPRMLNLPKRLSLVPATDVQARRRTQVLESMQAENRKSVPLVVETVDDQPRPRRKSRQSIAGLPPALRASAYFDHHTGPSQEFAVKGDSAKDTLESILDASARAPVSAFTDHPFAGQAGSHVYAAEQRPTSSQLSDTLKVEETKRRSSFNVLDTKHNSHGDPLNKLKKRNSSADMNLLVVRASETRMSLGAELDEPDEFARGPQADDTTGPRPRFYSKPASHHSDDDGDDDRSHRDGDEHSHHEAGNGDEAGEKELNEEEQQEQFFGAPTTLLAELQMRKAKQKTRNMNYATLVEQGMLNQHRTLLQLDDVAEKEKQKRIRKKVQLAWEAQDDDDDSDDDVPLGILFKKNNQRDHEWDRPLGLIEKRELEDNEPLSLRRNRLVGANPNRQRATSLNKRGNLLGVSPSQQHLDVPSTTTPGPESEEEEGETLADRLRRLKDKQMLESALGTDPRKSTISSDFASEMLGKLGISDSEEKAAEAPKPTPAPAAGEEEEETLGQRRARLQAEAASRGDFPSTARPGLPSNMSLADVLSANPMDSHNQAHTLTNEALVSHLPQGSLLQKSIMAEERRKNQRLNANMRSSSHGAYDPLVRDAPKTDQDEALAAKIEAYKKKMSGVLPVQQSQQPPQQRPLSTMMSQQRPLSTMMYPGPVVGAPQQQMMGMNGMGMGMMMPQPNLHAMHQQQMMPMNPMLGMQPQMNVNPNGMPGMPQPGMMNMQMMQGGVGMQMPMGMQMQPMMAAPPMNPQHRDMIDRWVQDVKQ